MVPHKSKSTRFLQSVTFFQIKSVTRFSKQNCYTFSQNKTVTLFENKTVTLFSKQNSYSFFKTKLLQLFQNKSVTLCGHALYHFKCILHLLNLLGPIMGDFWYPSLPMNHWALSDKIIKTFQFDTKTMPENYLKNPNCNYLFPVIVDIPAVQVHRKPKQSFCCGTWNYVTTIKFYIPNTTYSWYLRWKKISTKIVFCSIQYSVLYQHSAIFRKLISKSNFESVAIYKIWCSKSRTWTHGSALFLDSSPDLSEIT